MVVPESIRAELVAHAREEAPNECCGLVLVRDGVAIEYIRGVNKLASPYRYELFIDPFVWSEIDDSVEQVVFHSHPETEPRPSRTDRELAGLWSGRPFLIYGVKLDDLRGWRIARDEVEELPLTS
ncbi:MAG: [CysO sulfur-carrier protein]-S-L-cysteine hydrolase [Gaiellaceae bacterium]|nr:[CysO sulfur-carrier protein]-S-L-cysteine hydrolase [Gaiellaceae bacterium]